MGRKRTLRKQLRKRGLDGTGMPVLAVCIGKRCCPRHLSREVAEYARQYAAERHPRVTVLTVGCLDVCKKGPIAATSPTMKFKKHVDARRVAKMIRKLDR